MEVSETGNQKVFSIIIATYNCGQKIESTLQSIFSQKKELFEVIVLDSASTDNTLDYIKKYENDIVLISEKDDGVYYAFNRGIDLAAGKYIYFIGAGDCLKPNILEEINKFLPETPSFVYGKCYFTKQNVYNGKEFDSKLFIRDNLCQQGIFYHREIFNLVGKFDLQYKVLSDWMFNLKCFLHDGITKKYTDCVIADYEEGGLSAEITCDPVFLKEFPLFVRKQFGLYSYFMCKAFLKNPYLFNYIYYKKYYLLLMYLASKYSFVGYLVSLIRPFVQSFRNLKK
jgi:glycosyltransferase involved in cell wall biosynthesis